MSYRNVISDLDTDACVHFIRMHSSDDADITAGIPQKYKERDITHVMGTAYISSVCDECSQSGKLRRRQRRDEEKMNWNQSISRGGFIRHK